MDPRDSVGLDVHLCSGGYSLRTFDASLLVGCCVCHLYLGCPSREIFGPVTEFGKHFAIPLSFDRG